MLNAALLSLWTLSSPAWAWPAEGDWMGLEAAGASYVDDADDMVDYNAPSYLDLVGDATARLPVGYWFADDTDLYFRVRLDGDPSGDDFFVNEGSWVILMDLDGDLDNYEYSFAFASTGDAASLIVFSNASRSGGADDPAENILWTTDYSDAADAPSTARLLSAGSNMSLNPDYFLDITVPWDAFEKATFGAFSTQALFHVALATAEDEGDAASVDVDLAGVGSEDAMQRLSTAWSDTLTIDGDEDGLPFFVERALGTDPFDADTDDDGVDDGEEEDVHGTDPLQCDTDEDDLSDGLELGLVLEDIDEHTDTAAGCFVADADPLSWTDPHSDDTDGDSRPEWLEDVNANGQVDPWESDPQWVDVDTDGDGIVDFVEDQCLLTDGSGDDRDGDGVLDAQEGTDQHGWLLDSDGNGWPDFCDALPSEEAGQSTGDGAAGNGEENTETPGEEPDLDTGGLSGTCGSLPFTCDGRLTGGSCSVISGSALWLPSWLAVMGVVLRRRR